MEYWSIGVLEYWSVGVLECWSIGVLEYWSVGVLECWSIGVLEYWSIGVLEYWSIGVLEYWSIGVLSFGPTIPLLQHSNTPVLQFPYSFCTKPSFSISSIRLMSTNSAGFLWPAPMDVKIFLIPSNSVRGERARRLAKNSYVPSTASASVICKCFRRILRLPSLLVLT